MKNITVASLIAAPLLVFALAMPSLAADPAPTTCKDGTTTTSTGKGTCSGHGGVQKAKTTTPAAAPAAAPTAAPAKAAAPAAPAASGAATTCKDGTTTTSTGKGTCSGHGGVQKPTKAKPATAATTAAAPAAAAPVPAPAAAATAAAATPAAPAPAATTAAKSSTATKSAPTATAGNTDPTGATAKCKDGTYSKSAHRSGTCSSHGGVAEWLTAAQ
jgi:hypothetical protein